MHENYKAIFVKQNSSISAPLDANNLDLPVVLAQKLEIIPSVISEAAYEAVVEALHSIPDRIWNWDDLMKASKSLPQSLHVFVSVALKNYKTRLTARSLPTPTLMDVANETQMSGIVEAAFELNLPEALDSLPDDTGHRVDIINATRSLGQSVHLLHLRGHGFYAGFSPTSRAKCFFLRLCEAFRHPSQFANIFLDFCSLVHSFWDGRRQGPEVILPLSSLTKRPSSYLSRLLLRHSRDLPQHELRVARSLSENSHPWTVAVIDLNAVPLEIAQGRYSTGADIYGFVSMLLLVEILNFLLSPGWMILPSVLLKIMMMWMLALGFGDGMLTLLPPSKAHCTSTPTYALLLDEEFSVVLRGAQNLVEAITLRGFHFLYPATDVLQIPVWKVVLKLILEGYFQGLLYLIAILPVWCFVHPLFTLPFSQVLGTYLMASLFISAMHWKQWRHATRRFRNDDLRYYVQVTVDWIKLASMTAPITVSWFLYNHDHTMFNELQLLMELILAFLMSISSQNYPVRTAKFLDIPGKPPVKKWQFRTPAAAATFQCLVLCHDTRHPVRDINVRGMLDTLIPDQRNVWRAWKARVADRITHEVEISFAPTLPTFRNAKLQKQLEEYLDEAQYAYDAYRCYSLSLKSESKKPDDGSKLS